MWFSCIYLTKSINVAPTFVNNHAISHNLLHVWLCCDILKCLSTSNMDVSAALTGSLEFACSNLEDDCLATIKMDGVRSICYMNLLRDGEIIRAICRV